MPRSRISSSSLLRKGFWPGLRDWLFGALTQKAVQKFQCAENIVCSGSPATTGWGQVGARTRKALNEFGDAKVPSPRREPSNQLKSRRHKK